MTCVQRRYGIIASILISLTTVFISGCATRIPSPYEIQNPGHLLIGLGTTRITELQSLDVEIQKRGALPGLGSKVGIISLCKSYSIKVCEKPEYGDSDSLGMVVARSLPPGKYHIKSVRAVFLESAGGFGLFGLEPKSDLNIPFEIVSGKTSYLGRYWLDTVIGTNNPHSGHGRKAEVAVLDRLQSDRQFAQRKLPQLYGHVVSYLPDAASRESIGALSSFSRDVKYNASSIRSERLLDGKENNGCTWWCDK